MCKILLTELTQERGMSTLAEELGHLKNHVKYPADKQQVVSACNDMSDAPEADRKWVSQSLPEGTYRSADEVVGALLKKA